jgi:hypothetical protein
MAASRPLNEGLLGRGVRMRTVCLDSVRTNRPTVEHANWLARMGGQVRTVPSLPTRMILMDRRSSSPTHAAWPMTAMSRTTHCRPAARRRRAEQTGHAAGS